MNTTYTFDQLKEDVRKEAEALRIHATQEERGRLDLKKLDPKSIDRCIYGLMAGSCNSERAATLISLCACRYVMDYMLTEVASEGFGRIQRKVNGEKVEGFFNERTGDMATKHYSAIEAYILLPEANNANLISYLRGETEMLDL
jgi:hypothetical protein